MGPPGGVRVSVALCTWNGERHLEEQLTSIVGQTRPPDEVVVSDDASSDSTVSIVRDFARRNSALRLVSNDQRLGIRANFERAIRACSGDVVLLSDQDDVWLPRKVEAMVAAFDDPEVGFVRCDAIVVDTNLRPCGPTLLERHGGHGARESFPPIGVFGSASAFRASLARAILPIPEGWPHDVWIALVAAALSDEIVIDEPLQLYRRHPGSSSPARFVDFGARGRARQDLRHASANDYAVSIELWGAAVGRLGDLVTFWRDSRPELQRSLSEAEQWLALSKFREAVTRRPRLGRVRDVVRRFASGAYRPHPRPVLGAVKDLWARR